MTDTAGHPDVTEISDLTEGLLPPSRSMDIRRHLDDCSLCADVYESLEEIRGLLDTLPGPLHMPDDVADRIDAALSAEADGLSLDRPQHESSSGSGSGSEHVSRETSTAPNRPAGHSRGATGPGRPNRPRHGRRRTVALGAVFTAAALGLGGLIVQSMGSGSSGKDPASSPTRQSGSAYTFAGEKLEVQVSDLLARAEKKTDGSPRSSRPRGTESMESPGILNLPTDSVPVCIRRGIGRETPPIASKEGSYNGKDAYLVVLPALTDTDRVTAYVVDSACVDKPSVTAGKVLLKHSYPRN